MGAGGNGSGDQAWNDSVAKMTITSTLTTVGLSLPCVFISLDNTCTLVVRHKQLLVLNDNAQIGYGRLVLGTVSLMTHPGSRTSFAYKTLHHLYSASCCCTASFYAACCQQ